MTPPAKSRTGQARGARAVTQERESMVVPRGHAAAEHPPSSESQPEFVRVPRRTLDMGDAGSSPDAKEPAADAKTVMEREEWIRTRDQIALVVHSTVAEAILPLQEAIASIAERLDAMVAQPSQPPPLPRATMLPPPLPPERRSIPYVPPPMAASALTRLGDLAGKLRRERGIDVSPMQLAALLLERVAAVLDERVAEELARSSSVTGPASSQGGDPSS